MSQLLSCENEKISELVISRAADKLSTELDGETVILDIVSGMYSGLDQVGTTIWNMLEQPVDVKTIVAKVVDTYDVTEEQCTSDLLDFLNSLSENGLIVVQYAENT